ncbi:hypothetical protein SAMN02745157_1441 [Kaistia soli DSM 19436]|uniref:Uncharacterized protein n=1 Tax=Kaistia soli DSM 19436 TaxID=1122133 RepID=A0A1M4Y6P7_9HYPH|nr:hypothetical protein SAMN02745157_1441 [Kaistia soli DSM 19436]
MSKRKVQGRTSKHEFDQRLRHTAVCIAALLPTDPDEVDRVLTYVQTIRLFCSGGKHPVAANHDVIPFPTPG